MDHQLQIIVILVICLILVMTSYYAGQKTTALSHIPNELKL